MPRLPIAAPARRPLSTALAKTSQDTASRDIDDLLKRIILMKDAAGGRSTSYLLAKIDPDTRR